MKHQIYIYGLELVCYKGIQFETSHAPPQTCVCVCVCVTVLWYFRRREQHFHVVERALKGPSAETSDNN